MNERIKKLRKALNFTQQEFASRIGSTANVLTHYETGRRNPSRSVINNICKTFHVNEEWLRTGVGEMFADISWAERIEDFVGISLLNKPKSFQTRFLAMLSNLDESDWEVLERMAYAIIGERPAAPASEDTRPREEKPVTEWTEEEINAAAEEYRQSLLEEKRRAGSGSVSAGPSSSGTA